MATLQGKERAAYVQGMFDRIAGRYNLMNRLMTFGQDMRWRRFVIHQARLQRALSCSTSHRHGRHRLRSTAQVPGVQAVGAIFAWHDDRRQGAPSWRSGAVVRGGALNLPFPTTPLTR